MNCAGTAARYATPSPSMDRREFTRLAALGCGLRAISGFAPEPGRYLRANTDWLAKSYDGIGVQSTAQTCCHAVATAWW